MRRLLSLLVLPGLLVLGACGDDDSPMAPAAPIFDEITVSLDQINIERDCDGGAGGEFSYKFYVRVFEDDTEIATYLSQDFSSFSSGNFTAWDPNVETTFTLERRSSLRFEVRLSVRELDNFEDFSSGSFISHVVASGRPAWAPKEGNFIGESVRLREAGRRDRVGL